jgi:hypothetical protein
VMLRRRRPAFDAGSVIRGAPPMIIAAAAAMAFAAQALVASQAALGVDPPKAGILIQLVAATGTGGLAYLAVSRLFGVAEVRTVLEMTLAAVRREPAE